MRGANDWRPGTIALSGAQLRTHQIHGILDPVVGTTFCEDHVKAFTRDSSH
jgi:hypothetical protein